MDILNRLKTFGYAVQPDAIPVHVCEQYANRLDAIETRRRKDQTIFDTGFQAIIYGLHAECPDTFLHLLDAEPIFPVVQSVLSNGQQIILNSLSASRAIQVNENDFGDAWRAHIDTRMPAPDFGHTESVIAAICIDDFTVENGATRIWPYSHLSGMRPPPDIETEDLPGAQHMVAPKGSIIYWLGQTWHAISKNLSGQRRWCIIGQYTYWWIKPTFDYTHCGANLYSRLTSRQRGLLGFSSRPPISPDIRIFTVTKPEDLPDDYELAMGDRYALGQLPATSHKTADGK